MSRLRIGQLLLAVGFLSLVVGAWAGAQYRTATARRLFFVDPFGMAAAADGRIYVGVDRREVHAYVETGQPVAAWTVAADAGRFRLNVAEDGSIEVAREHPGERIVYEPDGKLIARHADDSAFERFGPERDWRVSTAGGLGFELTEEGLVRTSRDERTLVVAVPLAPLSWLGSRPIRPLTALLFVGTMGLIGGAVMTASVRRAD